jgi:hypothetical protein
LPSADFKKESLLRLEGQQAVPPLFKIGNRQLATENVKAGRCTSVKRSGHGRTERYYG